MEKKFIFWSICYNWSPFCCILHFLFYAHWSNQNLTKKCYLAHWSHFPGILNRFGASNLNFAIFHEPFSNASKKHHFLWLLTIIHLSISRNKYWLIYSIHRRNLNYSLPRTNPFTASKNFASTKIKKGSKPKRPDQSQKRKSQLKKRNRKIFKRSNLSRGSKRLRKRHLKKHHSKMMRLQQWLPKSPRELRNKMQRKNRRLTSLGSRKRKRARNLKEVTPRSPRNKRRFLFNQGRNHNSKWTCSLQWASFLLWVAWVVWACQWLPQCSIQQCSSSFKWTSSRNWEQEASPQVFQA